MPETEGGDDEGEEGACGGAGAAAALDACAAVGEALTHHATQLLSLLEGAVDALAAGDGDAGTAAGAAAAGDGHGGCAAGVAAGVVAADSAED